jgi:hypothetical protein
VLELSILQAFRPLEQRDGMMTMSDLTRPDCTAPEASTMCTLPAMAMRIPAPVTNHGAGFVCLPTVAGTTRATYTPAIAVPTAPAMGTCYVADVGTFTIDLGGIPITLTNTMVGGEWSGSPATQILDGLLLGFMSEADANSIYIPDGTTGIGAIDCQPLSMLLRGGNPPPYAMGQPQPPAPCPMRAVGSDPGANCQSGDDRDMGPGGAMGWYFYLNFRARVVPYTEM